MGSAAIRRADGENVGGVDDAVRVGVDHRDAEAVGGGDEHEVADAEELRRTIEVPGGVDLRAGVSYNFV